jgi:predicted transcriptional regulator
VKWLQIRAAPSELPASSPGYKPKLLDAGEIRNPERVKSAAEKTQKRAGATPLFRLSPPKKVSWSRSRPVRWSRAVFSAAQSEQTSCNAVRSTSREGQKEETPMALLKAPSKKPKTTTLQVRLEEAVKLKLEHYAEFIDATPSYVMSEALKLLFKKDEEFKHWLDEHPTNGDDHEIEGRLFTKTA